MNRRQPRPFADVKHSGLDDDIEPTASNTATTPRTRSGAAARRATSAAAVGLDFSTRWSDETMNRAKAAHLVDRVHDAKSTPTSFNGWVAVAVQMWARLSPSRRAQERKNLTLPPATAGASRPRKFRLPEGARIALEDAMRADELTGHREGRGTFVTHAVMHAINAASSRNGGDLSI